MNKALERRGIQVKALERRGIQVIFVHNPHPQDSLIKDLKGKVLFSSRNLSAVMKYLHQNQQLNVVKVEKGKAQSLPKPSKVVTKSLPIPIHRTQQYANHHDERRDEKRSINKIASCFNVSDEVAEKLLPYIEVIVPNFYSTAASGGIKWNEIDWASIDSKAGEAIEILSEAGWF